MRSRPRDEADLFHAALDADCADQAARLLLAEWLLARGDPAGLGYLWMARHGKYPAQDRTRGDDDERSWDWWSMKPGWNGGVGDRNDQHDRIDPGLLAALRDYTYRSNWAGDCAYCEYHTRRDAEAALVRALLRLGWAGGRPRRRRA